MSNRRCLDCAAEQVEPAYLVCGPEEQGWLCEVCIQRLVRAIGALLGTNGVSWEREGLILDWADCRKLIRRLRRNDLARRFELTLCLDDRWLAEEAVRLLQPAACAEAETEEPSPETWRTVDLFGVSSGQG